MAQDGGTARNGWSTRPSRHLSVREAADHLGVSEQRVYQLVRNGGLATYATPGTSRGGTRSRVWIPEAAVLERLAARSSSPGGRPRHASRSADTDDGLAADVAGSAEAAWADRDRWRAEALRLREAGRLMILAAEAEAGLTAKYAEAEAHQRDAADCLRSALGDARQASAYRDEALKQFMLPADLAEN